MKRLLFTITCSILFLFQASAQNEAYDKLENLKYYLASAKDNLQSMRYYTDSAVILSQIDAMNVNLAKIESVISTINIATPASEKTSIDISESDTTPKIEDLGDYKGESNNKNDDNDDNEDNDYKGSISKYMPFKNKFNTSFDIEFGINGLQNGTSVPRGVNPLEINTGGSWYWDFSIKRRARLGGKSSKIALNYGISYLKNRFKLAEDVRLTTTDNNIPVFVGVENLKASPKLNIGYINIPLSLRFSISKKTALTLGGYAGYRVHTIQKFEARVNNEKIEEQRYAAYSLNNWIYGATASLDIAGFDLIAKYNFSKLFKDNPNYDYNTFMIGTSISLF